MTDDIAFLSARELLDSYRRKALSPVEVTDAVLNRIGELDPKVNSFVTVTAEVARAAAKNAEQRYLTEDPDTLPAFLGVPLSVKDLEDTAGVRTTYGSVEFTNNVPDRDAIIWARMKAAGAVLIGKTTTPELGASGVTESELTGITRNPWALNRSAGGSSGGAAVAVASGFGPVATGSDGGGSIRVPASYCGVVGLKPTGGRIPFNDRDFAYEPVTTTGPMTRTVRDAALMLSIAHGPDLYDPYSLLESGIDYVAAIGDAGVGGLSIAYSPNLGSGPVAHATANLVAAAAGVFEEDLGARVTQIEIELPDPIEYFFDFWSAFIAVDQLEIVLGGKIDEAGLARYPFIKRALETSALDLARTQTVARSRIHTAFADVFAAHDLLIWPTTPSTAILHPGEAGYAPDIDGITLVNPELDNQRLTEAISHAGFPAITVPAGFAADGLPVGLQIAARRGREDLVLRAAAAFETARPWSHITPGFTS
jgi:Asp-tRNA(Asn)/Glu-tRNA(Gln) amidotransferase A subunit family amidase